jgi:hypothetical protein
LTNETPFDALLRRELVRDLATAVDALAEREAFVIWWRYGLGGRQRTLRSTATALRTSNTGVLRIEIRALSRLRHCPRLKAYRPMKQRSKPMTESASKLHDAAKKNDSAAITAILSGLAARGGAARVIAVVQEIAAADPESSRYIAGHLEVSADGDAYRVTVRQPGPAA